MADLIGTSIDGWRVVSQIGEGSMGTVWDARKGNKRAALKLMRPDAASADSLPRFRREAKLLIKIRNPHVMRCYALGEREDGFVYLLLEYLDGGNLEEMLERRGRLTIPQAICAIRAVLNGLAAIHDQGVVHRDIKPANLILDREGMVKVADFGLARKGEASTSLTATGTILGTPFYMAPEQCRGEELDGRLDLYAVGVLLYHLATGEPPYDGKNALAILQQHMTADVPDLRHKIPDAPLQVVEAIGAMMSKSREDRPADARAALKLLKGLVEEPLPRGGIRGTGTGSRARAVGSERRRRAGRASGTQMAISASGSRKRPSEGRSRRSSGSHSAIRPPKNVGPPPVAKPLPRVAPSRLVDVFVLLLAIAGLLAGIDYGMRLTQARDGLGEVEAVLEQVREGAHAAGSENAERADRALALAGQVREVRPWLDKTIPLWGGLILLLVIDRLLARFTQVGPLGRVVLSRRASKLIKQGEYYAAAKVYEQLGRRDKGGELLMAHEMPGAAAEVFGHGALFQRLGDALMAAGKKREALRAYVWAGADQQAGEAPPATTGGTSREVAEELARSGKLDEAIEAHLDTGRRYDAADLLERGQRLDEARQALEQAYSDGGGRDYWHHTRKKGPVEQARPTLARRIARLCQKTGDLSAAAGYLEKSGDLLEAADIYAELGEFHSRARCLLGGVPAQGELNPRNSDRVLEAALSLAEVNDPSAVDLFKRVSAWREAAELSRELGDNLAAAELFAQAEQFAEGAACAGLAGDKSQAAELYVKAHNNERASELYEELGELGEAADQARRAGNRARQATLLRKAKRWLDAARSFLDQGNSADALACLKGVKKRDPDWEESRGILGDVHYKEGRYKEAKAAYAQGVPDVIYLRDQVPSALNYVSTLEALGEIKKAMEILERVNTKELAPADISQRRARLQSKMFLAGSDASASASGSSSESALHSSGVQSASAGAKVAQGIKKATDLVGTTQGNWELLRFIGQGSFAWVYEALDKETGKNAAIKVLKPSLTSSNAPKRFLREGTSLAGLKNPHVVEIYDMGDVDGIYYLALEFVKGSTLKKLIADEAPFPVPKAARLGAQILDGVGAAHRKGVVHRDLKPANVLVTREKAAKVLDFGLARVFEEGAKSASAGYLGTPRYSSPEQARGEDVGKAADQYAAALMVYEMLTGKFPFEAKTSLGYLNLHATEPPRPIRDLRPEVPAELDAAVLKALEKQPRDRFPDVSAFARALNRFTKRGGQAKRKSPPRRAPADSRRGRRPGP